VLGNEDKRKQYDAYGPGFEEMGGGPGGPGGFGAEDFIDPRDFFAQFAQQFGGGIFNEGGPGGQRRGAARGSDIDVRGRSGESI
jgi:DnaJ-class molecular chaperone